MKNEFYIVEQPKKSILTIITVDSKLPMDEEKHKRICDLSLVSDIIFIFPKDSKKNIRAAVFASLYKACGYIESSEERLGNTLMRAFEYDKEIFNTHVLIMYTQLSDLVKIEGNKLQLLASSDINKPIFKTRILSSSEFFETYGIKKDKWYKKILKLIRRENTEENNRYCTNTVESSCILLRPRTIKKFLEFSKKDNTGYVNSFTYQDQRYLLASMCDKLKIEIFDFNPEEVSL